jgi:hypothetical protein
MTHLTTAIEGLVAEDIGLFVHPARRRLGQLVSGDEGAAMVASAEAALTACGVKDLEAWTRMLVPGFEAPPARARLGSGSAA